MPPIIRIMKLDFRLYDTLYFRFVPHLSIWTPHWMGNMENWLVASAYRLDSSNVHNYGLADWFSIWRLLWIFSDAATNEKYNLCKLPIHSRTKQPHSETLSRVLANVEVI